MTEPSLPLDQQNIYELAQIVARMDAKLDTLLLVIPDHEDRLKSMERKWNILTGFTIAFTAIGTILGYMYDIVSIFKHTGKV